MAIKVAVLMGGMSAEREVSLSSGKGVAEALKGLGYEVWAVDVGTDIAEQLTRKRPDVVFNALHGRYGEDGCVQGVLEILKIPYTHSGVLASAIAMNKVYAKKVFEAAGIPTVQGQTLTKSEILAGKVMLRPFVIKPIDEGSSVGVQIVMEGDAIKFPTLADADRTSVSEDPGDSRGGLGGSPTENKDGGATYLIEKYIPGREVQAAVLRNRCIGAIEIRPQGKFYDYEAKYTDGKAIHLMPAPINKEAYDKICDYALRAHQALGCRGVTRSDFRYDDTKGEPGEIYILETNTQPGMTPLSLSPEIAAHAGISYAELVDTLVKEALSWRA